MNRQPYLDKLLPETRLADLSDNYLTWSGAGFACFFVADALDHLEAASYAAYYTGAVNAAISPQFWLLLGVTSFLLLCLTLPVVYLSRQKPQLEDIGVRLRRTAQRFFRVAFAIGALLIGLMLANVLHANDRAELLASAPLWSGTLNPLAIAALFAVNSLFWLVGEALCNSSDTGYSGVVRLVLHSPLKYSLPVYAAVAGALLYFIVSRQ